MTAAHIATPEVLRKPKLWQHSATVFAICLAILAAPRAHSQSFAVLHEFSFGEDGITPPAGPTVNAADDVFGVAQAGGSFNYGIVYRLSQAGKETILHSFIGGEGLWPAGGLLVDAAENIYGTTADGGTAEGGRCAHGCGTVFKIDPAGKHTILYSFHGTTDGGAPNAKLIQDSSGNLYGTTVNGGVPSCYVSYGCGVIFKLDSANHETVLHSFMDGIDGKMAEGLVADTAGNLYSTTYDGGTYGYGCIFKLDPSGTLTVIYSFTGGADGSYPAGHLVIDEAGNLYGATNAGPSSRGYGVVFKLDTANKFTVLHSFVEASDGEYPNSLVRDSAGNLYGVTQGGGASSGCYYVGCGTVFKLDANNNKTVLHNFVLTDGQLPDGLTMDKGGNLYGTTLGGGKGAKGINCSYYKGCGVVFKLTP